MELKTLHTFVTVVQEGSISAAARQLHMTQPPLSAHIAQLEAEMHTCLFQRGGRHIRLTPAGEELYRRAVPILEMARLAKEEVSRYGEGVEDTIHMGVVSSVAGLVGWLPAYCQAHPKVRFELFEGNTYHLLQQIRAGVLQLAIVRTPFAPGELETVPLLEESLVAVGKENWFRDENGYLPETISLAELANKPLIVYRRWEGVLSRIFERKGLRLNTFCCNDDARTTLTWAAQGPVWVFCPVPWSAIGMRKTILKWCFSLWPKKPCTAVSSWCIERKRNCPRRRALCCKRPKPGTGKKGRSFYKSP